MKIALIPNPDKDENLLCTKSVIKILNRYDADVMMLSKYINFLEINNRVLFVSDTDEMIKECDIAVAIGGDGTIIKCAKLCYIYRKSILGINIGRIGFMSGLEAKDIHKLSMIFTGEYIIDSRTVIDVKIDNRVYHALNDVYIMRGTSSQIADYCLSREGQCIFEYRADGIIISTPSGSTAYSLSAGGPIVDSDMECIIITPVCPHSLISRSLILNSEKVLKLSYTLRKRSEVFISVDGNVCLKSSDKGEFLIYKSDLKADFIKIDNDNIYKKVQEKLIGTLL